MGNFATRFPKTSHVLRLSGLLPGLYEVDVDKEEVEAADQEEVDIEEVEVA